MLTALGIWQKSAECVPPSVLTLEICFDETTPLPPPVRNTPKWKHPSPNPTLCDLVWYPPIKRGRPFFFRLRWPIDPVFHAFHETTAPKGRVGRHAFCRGGGDSYRPDPGGDGPPPRILCDGSLSASPLKVVACRGTRKPSLISSPLPVQPVDAWQAARDVKHPEAWRCTMNIA